MSYVQKQKIIETPTVANDKFGSVLATDGESLVSVANNTSTLLADVYFYERDDSFNWVLKKALVSPSDFVTSANITRGICLAGIPSDSSDQGRVAIYKKVDDWTLDSSLTGSLAGDDYGFSLDVKGGVGDNNDILVIGSPGTNSDRGSVFVYESTDADWGSVSASEVVPDIRISGARFGTQVSVAGDYIVVGSYEESSSSGAIYIYLKDDDGVWQQTQKIQIVDSSTNDQFGWSLKGEEDFFIVGAPNEISENGEAFAGAAYLFENINGSWELASKLVSSDVADSSRNVTSDYYGYSVNIGKNFAAVGSYNARGRGMVDVFSKARGWNYLRTLVASDGVTGDNFGLSVVVNRNFIFIGAPGVDDVASNAGSVYFFENKEPALKLAQEFNVGGDFVPSKASVYLKRSGKNIYDYFPIEDDKDNVIDATNFQSIKQKRNKVIFNDSVTGFSDNGYIQFLGDSIVALQGTDDSNYSIITYPVKAIDDGIYNFWFRVRVEDDNPSASGIEFPFVADVLLDNVLVTTINQQVLDNRWVWINTTFTFSDNVKHNLGIRIKGKNNLLDKILITKDSQVPILDGPPIIIHPFITVHLKMYEALGGEYPVNSLYIYDYKNSIDEVVNDDWYNFNVKIIDESLGYTSATDFPDNYFLVLSTSGNVSSNYVTWEMVDNDEYSDLFSAIKY